MKKASQHSMPEPSEFKIGGHSFDLSTFIMVSAAGVVLALTASSFLPAATRSSTWPEMLFSGQAITLILLLAISAFILLGISRGNRKEWRTPAIVMIVAFLAGHIESVLFGGVGAAFRALMGG